jgi:hypothetical protein
MARNSFLTPEDQAAIKADRAKTAPDPAVTLPAALPRLSDEDRRAVREETKTTLPSIPAPAPSILADLAAAAGRDTFAPPPSQPDTNRNNPANWGEIDPQDRSTWPEGWTKNKPPGPKFIGVGGPTYEYHDETGLWHPTIKGFRDDGTPIYDVGEVIAGQRTVTRVADETGNRFVNVELITPRYIDGDENVVLREAVGGGLDSTTELAAMQRRLLDAGYLDDDKARAEQGTMGAETTNGFRRLLADANRAGLPWQEMLQRRTQLAVERMSGDSSLGYAKGDEVTILRAYAGSDDNTPTRIVDLQRALVMMGKMTEANFRKSPGVLDGETRKAFADLLDDANLAGKPWDQVLTAAIEGYRNDPDLQAIIAGDTDRDVLLGLTEAKRRSSGGGGGGGGGGRGRSGGGGGGAVAASERASAQAALSQLAADYAVPMSTASVSKWIDDVMNGAATYDDFKLYLTQMAASRFPWLADSLNRGQTVRQIQDPYIQIASQVLGIVPDTVNMNDPKWLAGLEMTDPKTGAMRAMTIAEWQQFLKSSGGYGYNTSRHAQSSVADLLTAIGQAFGKV